MIAAWRDAAGAVARAVADHLWLWLGIAAAVLVGYHAALLAAMMVRFGHAPNFFHAYRLFHNYAQILAGTPAWSDTLSIMADEPLAEIGYLHPEYGIAEWSLFLLPAKLLIVAGLGLLLATFTVVLLRPKGQACPALRTPQGVAAAGAGGALVALSNATLTWVVCCATPSWVVVFSMLGLSVSTALWLEPLGNVMTGAGALFLVGATVLQARRRARLLREFAPTAAPQLSRAS